MPVEISLETVVIYVAFIVGVFSFYKMFKLIMRGSLIVFASFTFPWVAQYFGLPIIGSIETGINFALAGLGMFLIYEFFHFITHFFRLLMWPFRRKKKE